MSILLKPNAVNQIAKGTVIFGKDEKTSYICLVAKGQVLCETKGLRVVIEAGQMMCVFDAYFSQSNLCTYTALEDCVIYAVPATSDENVMTFLGANPDYRGVVFASLCKQLNVFYRAYKELSLFAKNQYEFVSRHYDFLKSVQRSSDQVEEFLERDPAEETELDAEEDEIEFYVESSKVPGDVHAQYYNRSESMIEFQVKHVSNLIRSVIYACADCCSYIDELYHAFVNANGSGIYELEVQYAIERKRNGTYDGYDLKRVNESKACLIKEFSQLEEDCPLGITFERKKIDDLMVALIMEPMAEEIVIEKIIESIDLTRFKDSLKQILDYADLSEEFAKEYTELINSFIGLSDKFSTEDEVRQLRKKITSGFYEIYERVAFTWMETGNAPIPVTMFLNYGFIDERLLTEEELEFLLHIEEEETEKDLRIYRVSEWLKAILNEEKHPSRNEFEQDYYEYLREQRKTGYITAEDEKVLTKDRAEKVKYEIRNMIRYNSKVVNGKISTYVPILYKEEFYGEIGKAFLSKKFIKELVLKTERKDFSVFNKTVIYSKPQEKVDREYVQKKVYPDIVLLPVVGSQGSMWQEIETRKRDTPGRFLLPAFSEENAEAMMIRMFGRYRWEYCRCEMGASWNNIQFPSLTAEYSDYIQYYRKNRQLSQEKREKVKLQIQKGKNNLREIFVQDYYDWIKNEAEGAVRLNKVSREILATYCPLTKEIRKEIDKNASMTDAMKRFRREWTKNIKDYESRMRYLERNGAQVPDEMQKTYEYYLSQEEEVG